MVFEYYNRDITDFSKDELEDVLSAGNPPICLVGGWAVYFHVNVDFKKNRDRDYIGSRDIDLGIHIDPTWDENEMKNSAVGKTLDSIENELGYERSRFGFVKYFNRKTGEVITEEQSKEMPLHDIFSVFVDIIPDSEKLETFKDTFGFKPPSEPLLEQAFENDKAELLEPYVEWGNSASSKICDIDLLAAMKIRSIPQRDKEHKRVKDVCDLHALLWYPSEFGEMVEKINKIVAEKDLKKLEDKIDEEVINNASNLVGVDKETLRESIERLYF